MQNSPVKSITSPHIQHSHTLRDDVERLICAAKYGENANGEGGQFNCWGLLRYIEHEHFGIDLPTTSLGNAMARLYDERMKSGNWQVVDEPFHGAGVLMRAGADPHCGVWLEFDGGGVLHCERGTDVRFIRSAELRMHGYSKLKFYRFENNG